MSKLAKFCRRCRARSDLYTGGAGKVWTVYELACFLSPLVVDVVLPVLMQRQALAVLVSCSGGATDSVLRRHGVPVLGLWLQAKARAHRFHGALEGVEEFHTFPMRSLAESAGVRASVYGGFRENFSYYLRVACA